MFFFHNTNKTRYEVEKECRICAMKVKSHYFRYKLLQTTQENRFQCANTSFDLHLYYEIYMYVCMDTYTIQSTSELYSK